MRINDRQKHDRPREKLQAKGAEALSDYELLMAIIGSGNKQADVTVIAKNVLKLFKTEGGISYQLLAKVDGIGAAKATEITAAFELAKRYLADHEQPIISDSDTALEQLADIRNKKQEYLVCLTLDGANRLIAKRVITIGTLTSSLVHPREVFADAITDRAASIIVAHNHPSGRLVASPEDKEVTKRLVSVGEMVGIDVIDHIIVAPTGSISIL